MKSQTEPTVSTSGRGSSPAEGASLADRNPNVVIPSNGMQGVTAKCPFAPYLSLNEMNPEGKKRRKFLPMESAPEEQL